MKEEAKAEKKALEVDVKELADIQRMQKNAIKVCCVCHSVIYLHIKENAYVTTGGGEDQHLLRTSTARVPQRRTGIPDGPLKI